MKTDLYRAFNLNGRLLYVGISLSALKRAMQHREKSKWFPEMSRLTVQSFPTRRAAAEAERRAILLERPRYNIVHNIGPEKQHSASGKGRPKRSALVETELDASLFSPDEIKAIRRAARP